MILRFLVIKRLICSYEYEKIIDRAKLSTRTYSIRIEFTARAII